MSARLTPCSRATSLSRPLSSADRDVAACASAGAMSVVSFDSVTALADGITSAGGLGLARQLTQEIK